jgi:hypothetical protein
MPSVALVCCLDKYEYFLDLGTSLTTESRERLHALLDAHYGRLRKLLHEPVDAILHISWEKDSSEAEVVVIPVAALDDGRKEVVIPVLTSLTLRFPTYVM